MTRYGFHASHEQHSPRDLLNWVALAEQAGFDAGMCSDHFHPWVAEQGQSGFAWSWLGAAMASTTLDFGCVTAPGDRYHPAIIAQAAATLAALFPGRFWIAVGSGEALNEHITGNRWPPKDERHARLAECVQVMRALWAGETVTHRGRITVEEARLYTLPEQPPRVFAAALTADTARWAGRWADGLITVGAGRQTLEGVIHAFREGGGDGKPIKVQAALSWARSESQALADAHREWSANLLGTAVLPILRTPAEFAAAAQRVRPDDVVEALPVSADPDFHIAHLAHYRELGVETVYLHNVARAYPEFIDVFARRVLPALQS